MGGGLDSGDTSPDQFNERKTATVTNQGSVTDSQTEETDTTTETTTESTTSSSSEGTSTSTGTGGAGDTAQQEQSSSTSTGSSSSSGSETERFGKASNREALRNLFDSDYVSEDNITDLEDTGIEGGNTTGDKIEVVELEGSNGESVGRVFVTPKDAFPTMTCESQERAVQNNLNAPEVIESLGGNACRAETVTRDGDVYIVREGVEGEPLEEHDGELSDKAKQSTVDTLTAAYFAGNSDIHDANVVLTENDELYVIDHDASSIAFSERGNAIGWGSPSPGGSPADSTVEEGDVEAMRHSITPARLKEMKIGELHGDLKESIYDKAVAIKTGEVDIETRESLRDGKAEIEEYAETAADLAIRRAVLDKYYDVPEEAVPDGMNETPTYGEGAKQREFDSLDDFADGMQITFIDTDTHEKVTGEIKRVGHQGLEIAEEGRQTANRSVREETLEEQILEIDDIPFWS